MRGWGVLGACLLVLSACGAAPALAGVPSGLALARAVRGAFEHVSAESYEQIGFAYALSEEAPEPVFRWRWGGGPIAGMVPVREEATMGLKEGRVRWWRDDLTPLPCIEATLCGEVASSQAPVELLVLPSGTYYAYGDEASHGCYGRLGGSTPVSPGERTWTLLGEFAAPERHGSTQLLQSSFPWGLTGGRASESTSVSLRSHLPLREQTTIVPSGGTGQSFSFSAAFSYPAHAKTPKPDLCQSGA